MKAYSSLTFASVLMLLMSCDDTPVSAALDTSVDYSGIWEGSITHKDGDKTATRTFKGLQLRQSGSTISGGIPNPQLGQPVSVTMTVAPDRRFEGTVIRGDKSYELKGYFSSADSARGTFYYESIQFGTMTMRNRMPRR